MRVTGRRLTVFAMALSGLAFLVSEGEALVNQEEGDTWSSRIAEGIRQYPVVAALPVAVAVHCSTPTATKGESFPWWRGPGVAVLAGIGLGLVWARYDKSRPTGGAK